MKKKVTEIFKEDIEDTDSTGDTTFIDL